MKNRQTVWFNLSFCVTVKYLTYIYQVSFSQSIYVELNIILLKLSKVPGSSVGIATAYELDGLGIESRWGARFSTPVQTGPEANPASCTMGTGSFPAVRCGRGVTLTPHPILTPRSKLEYS